ncbi:hypothetical protein NM688_g677 [Phlebia brevispora]|uniref:Uncharacterized protein n=1 Tax=Phlebia brevispora TaxID=194682 RepID=A0ACC1TDU0_9APHY|nr:hypothetical protein NM688_g677 [Phlebia brevispora]
MFPLQTWIVVVVLAVALKVAQSVIHANRLRKIMPPGPPGWPLLGNYLDVGSFQWLRFTEWKDRYGPIFSLYLAGQPTVVLNDFTVAADLLDRRSNIYSSKPRIIMANEIMMGGLSIGLVPYGDRWRRMRRATHEAFAGRSSEVYWPLQEKESTLLAMHILDDSHKWRDHFKRSAASTMLCAIYGWLSIDSSSDTVVKDINDFMQRILTACLPGSYLVDFFPSMLYLPLWLAPWKRKGMEWHEKDTKMFQELIDGVKVKMQSGDSDPCFAKMLLETEGKHELSDRESAWLAGVVYGAGSETTAATLEIFILAMLLYPNVMRRAQSQIDTVVGRGRLPLFGDKESLPYIDAIVKEVLRWRPVGPLALPRFTTQDDWYKGYFIPKGTLVILNVWAMNRDPNHFPDYDEFRPERYLGASGELVDLVPDTHGQGHMTYSCGRRACVGKDLANQALFMDIAAILWAFNIEKATDEKGEAISSSSTDFVEEGVLIRPAPFKCSFTPRSPEVSTLIHSTADTYATVKTT